MLDGILRRKNFKSKCKMAVTRTRTRLEVIKRKRNAMHKFLKKDIADLMKTNLGCVAYTRAEGLCIELNLSTCYDYVEECCKFVAIHLKTLNEQRECPEECKVVVSSLIYGAARFADLPELRDLRNQFYEKYCDSLGAYVNKEFVENLKSKPPTKEMKLQVMQEVAKEFGVTWDPNTLKRQLQYPSKTILHEERDGSDVHSIMRNKSLIVAKGEFNKGDEENSGTTNVAKLCHKHSCSMMVHGGDAGIYKTTRQESGIETGTGTQTHTDSVSHDSNETVSSEVKCGEEDKARRPKSVRTKYYRACVSSCSSDNEFGLKDTWTARAPRKEENQTNHDHIVLPLPPGRRRYFSKSQPTSPYKKDDDHDGDIKSQSKFSHLHPRMQDFDQLTQRIAALKHK